MSDPNESTRMLARAVREGPPVDLVREEEALAGLREKLFGEAGAPPMVDRYVLQERLGTGASAIVYRAFDPELGRDVAIKLLQSRRGSTPDEDREMSARLLREAQAIATLSHPNVVAVYDVGTYGPGELGALGGDAETTGTGGVFMVMEVVDGVELRQWLRQDRRHWREIYDVFLAAGEGLAAAHDAGLVHRDFKPSNVVLGADGRVRVLDFGLVRSVRPDGFSTTSSDRSPAGSVAPESGSAELTQTGSIMGTPAYMAPEQHVGDTADARADVFAYCVSFWEGLHGTRPFAGRTAEELAAAKRQGRMVQEAPRSDTPRWLDVILERGLAADVSRRPTSMRVLLRELHEVPRRRRRIGLGVAAGAVAVTLLGAVGLRDQARAEAACGDAGASLAGIWDERTPGMLRRAFENTGQTYATAVSDRTVAALEAYAGEWVRVRDGVCMDTVGRGSESIDVMARRLACLDLRREQMSQVVNVFLAADDAVVRNAGRVVSELRPPATCALTPGLEETVDAVEVERAVQGALALRNAGRPEDALAEATRVVADARRNGESGVESHALTVQGTIQMDLGQFEEAEASLHDAQAAGERAGRSDLVTAAQVRLVGLVGFALERHTEAERLAATARARLRRHATEQNMPEHARLALEGDLAHSEGLVRVSQGRYREARDAFERALGLRKQAHGDDHLRVAFQLAALGTVNTTLGEHERAAEYLQEALALHERQLGPDHPDVGMGLLNLADNLRQRALAREGLEHVARAREIWGAAAGEQSMRFAQALQIEGGLLLDLGRHDAAEKALRRSAEIFDGLELPPMPAVATDVELAALELARGNHAEAAKAYAAAIEIVEQAVGEGHASALDPLIGLGEARLALDEPEEAEVAFNRAREIQDRFGTLETDTARIDLGMASVLRQRDPEKARKLAARALEKLEGNPDPSGYRLRVQALLQELADER